MSDSFIVKNQNVGAGGSPEFQNAHVDIAPFQGLIPIASGLIRRRFETGSYDIRTIFREEFKCESNHAGACANIQIYA